MNGSETPPSLSEFFDEDTALEIGDKVKLILAPTLPGCTARRYDFPPGLDDYWGVELCFADHGPIVPKLSMCFSKYFSLGWLSINYISMLRDSSDHAAPFPCRDLPGSARLDTGPVAVAMTLRQSIDKVDFAGILAAGTVERILDDYPTWNLPKRSFNLAQCALYLGRNGEARSLLQDVIKYAQQDGRQMYEDTIAEAERYLDTDPDSLRHELLAMIDYNWSHLKVIGA